MLLDGLSLAVQVLELERQLPRALFVLGEDQLECDVRTAEASRGVDPRGEPEAHRRRIDSCGIDPRAPHQRLEAGPPRAGEGAKARRSQRAVLVDERDDVCDRGEGDEIEVLP